MKVLYLSNFSDLTGYSAASTSNVLALDSVGVKVIPRTIKFNNVNAPLPERLQELEKESEEGVTHILQHTLPIHMNYQYGAKNIGLFATETNNLSYSNWPNRINLMDEIWIFNEKSKQCSINSGITKPIYVVPHCFDMSKYERDYPKLDLPDTFKFYFIGELNRRKNYADLIKAFHTEFSPNEPVDLVLKVNKSGLNPQQCLEMIRGQCSEIKKAIKLYKDLGTYKSEIIITDFMTEEQIYSLHNSCDCFVYPTRGEAFALGVFDAMAFGKTPIVTKNAGIEYVSEEEGYLVDSYEDICFGEMDTFFELYNGKDTWQEVSILDLRRKMRLAYENRADRSKSLKGMERAYDYSYEKVGILMKNLLEGL